MVKKRSFSVQDGDFWARRDVRSDSGSAVVEFIAVTLTLLIPVVYLVVCLARIQAGALAAESAAYDAGRSLVVTGVAELERGATYKEAFAAGAARASAVTDLTLGAFGFSNEDADFRVTCSTETCLAPGGNVYVEVDVAVALPGVPAFVGRLIPLEVTVSSRSTAPVDGLAGEQ